MRRRRRSSFRKEKAIMLTSSALVLTALTATGFYVRNLGEQEEEQIVDFADLEEESMEEQVYDMYGNLQGTGEYAAGESPADGLTASGEMADSGELDYDPGFTEANSGSVDNPGLTENADAEPGTAASNPEMTAGEADIEDGKQTAENTADEEKMAADAGDTAEVTGNETARIYEDEVSVAASADVISDAEETDAMSSLPALSFTESDALVWPIAGNVLVNYSMDKTVYFATLQQYKYSPAIVISATAGEGITAAADGKVTKIYTDPEIGTAVVMDLGDGYELTYGQLTDLTVSEGNYVTCGEIIGKVAEPTKYYSVEGTNVYFKLTKDGQPVNPLSRLG